MTKRMEIGISGEMLDLNSFPWIQSVANQLGVSGVVFTKNDGSIRILVQGEESILQSFADQLSTHTIFARNAQMYAKLSDPEIIGNFWIVSDEN